MKQLSLLFVYNAKSDFWSKKLDFAHKIISPSTYKCSLCALTHGNFGETELWQKFKEESGIKMTFMYKDEFLKKYPEINETFPVIFQKKLNTPLQIFLKANQLTQVTKTEQLVKKISTNLNA